MSRSPATPDANASTKSARSPDLLDLLSGGEPPAFANDQNHRIIFWNKGAERIMQRTAAQALGRLCHEVFCGRDFFGNRFCDEDCAVSRALVRHEAVRRFEISTGDSAHGRSLGITVIEIPDSHPGYFTAVHILDEIDESGRLAREIARLREAHGATPIAVRPAKPYGAGAVQPRPGVLPVNAPAAKEGLASETLSPREMDVLRAIAAGQANKEIASALHISVATTRNHVQRILRKLNVHSKLEAVALAFRQGWN